MKWFTKWFQKRHDVEANCKSAGVATLSRNTVMHSDYDDEHVVNLRIYAANGGVIVETSKYDKNRDRHRTKIYVVADGADTDLGNELSKIVTMESLR